jgi:beta-lactamase class D
VQDATLERFLRERGVDGVVVVLDRDAPEARCSHLDRCTRAYIPASTFKIPNSIIGLETGVIADADFVIPWDHVQRDIAAWNHDHTLRSAIRDSVVPYYQELARRVGPAAMQAWLDRLAYGNRQLGAVVDQFWLEGPLEVTPIEQVDFLRRLVRAELPIQERTRSILLEILVRGEIEGRTFRGKTGWAHPGRPDELGWFVGWTGDAEQARYVAVLVFHPPDGVDMASVRPAIAEAALREAF